MDYPDGSEFNSDQLKVNDSNSMMPGCQHEGLLWKFVMSL